jgi:hypothetical protein
VTRILFIADLLDPDDRLTGLTVNDIGGFGEDAAGRLYIADLAQNEVFRLVTSPSSGTLATDPLTGPFTAPVAVAVAGIPGQPSRLLVAERAGTVRLVVDGAALSPPFLDVTPFGLTSDGERGLLGVAAPPDFASSGKVYVYYTDGEGDIRIDEFRRSAADPDIADPSSRRPSSRSCIEKRATTMAARSSSVPTAAYGRPPETGAAGETSSTTPRISGPCSARCCASIPTRPVRAVLSAGSTSRPPCGCLRLRPGRMRHRLHARTARRTLGRPSYALGYPAGSACCAGAA